MVTTGIAGLTVHPLLNDGPISVIADEKSMQIQIGAVLHGSTVNFGNEPARAGESRAVEPDFASKSKQFIGRLTRMFTASAADMEAKFCGLRTKPRLRAPITLVVIPEECQSIPMTAPND
jgi:hypothetical protein